MSKTLTWDPAVSTNSASQQAKKRVRGVFAWDISGFIPSNNLTIDQRTAVVTIPSNIVYQFQIDHICTVNGPTGSVVKESIEFLCLVPVVTATDKSVTVAFSNIPSDITRIGFELRNTANAVIETTSVPVNGGNCSYTFNSLNSSSSYKVYSVLYAIINSLEVQSVSTEYMNSQCGPSLITTGATPAPCPPATNVYGDCMNCQQPQT